MTNMYTVGTTFPTHDLAPGLYKLYETDELFNAYMIAHTYSISHKLTYCAVRFNPIDEPAEIVVIFHDGVKIYERDD